MRSLGVGAAAVGPDRVPFWLGGSFVILLPALRRRVEEFMFALELGNRVVVSCASLPSVTSPGP